MNTPKKHLYGPAASEHDALHNVGRVPHNKGKKVTDTNVRDAVKDWARRPADIIAEYCTADLTRAAATLRQHPDHDKPGYSQAAVAYQKVTAELASRS